MTAFRPGDRVRLSTRGLKQYRNTCSGVPPADRRGTVMAMGPSARPRVWWDHLLPQRQYAVVWGAYLEQTGANLEDARARRRQLPLFGVIATA